MPYWYYGRTADTLKHRILKCCVCAMADDDFCADVGFADDTCCMWIFPPLFFRSLAEWDRLCSDACHSVAKCDCCHFGLREWRTAHALQPVFYALVFCCIATARVHNCLPVLYIFHYIASCDCSMTNAQRHQRERERERENKNIVDDEGTIIVKTSAENWNGSCSDGVANDSLSHAGDSGKILSQKHQSRITKRWVLRHQKLHLALDTRPVIRFCGRRREMQPQTGSLLRTRANAQRRWKNNAKK